MNEQIPRYVTEARAALLLQLSLEEVERISKEAGLGYLEQAGTAVERYFLYEDVLKMSELAKTVAHRPLAHSGSPLVHAPSAKGEPQKSLPSPASSEDTVDWDLPSASPAPRICKMSL